MIIELSSTLTTTPAGDVTVYLGSRLRGRVHAIHYTIGTLDTAADLVVSGETTGVPILTDSPAASEWWYPRAFANAVTTGAAGTAAQEDVEVFLERIKVRIAQGGDTKTGTITVYLDIPDTPG